MATYTGRIQVRRGSDANFDKSKLRPGEFAAVTNTNNPKVYMQFGVSAADVKEIPFNDNVEYFEKLAESFAHGNTGARPTEDTDNAKYYCDLSNSYNITTKNYRNETKTFRDETEEYHDEAEEYKEWIEDNFDVNITKIRTQGLVNTYRIKYNNDKEYTFDVTDGSKGDKGDRGDSGVTVPISGMFALSGDAEGNLYALYAEGSTPPSFEVDENHNIYYVTPDN